jgi:hypothetical protein
MISKGGNAKIESDFLHETGCFVEKEAETGNQGPWNRCARLPVISGTDSN